MVGVIGIVALLTLLILSHIVTRMATTALVMTGMSSEAARFQARSAFTGTGFTTSESEQAVNHPVRRRILMLLMILRNAGFVTIALSLVVSFIGTDEKGRSYRLLVLLLGVFVLWLISRSKAVDRFLSRLIRRALARWTNLDVRYYASLLKLSGQYAVTEMQVRRGDWVTGKCLRDCKLSDEGITVLGIYRADGTYEGAPRGPTEIRPDDTLILYGRDEALHDLDSRTLGLAGDMAHHEAVYEHKEVLAEKTEPDTPVDPGPKTDPSSPHRPEDRSR